jgi:hypothetical protein
MSSNVLSFSQNAIAMPINPDKHMLTYTYTCLPIALNEKPEDQRDWVDPPLRTVLANVRITALTTLRII